VITWGRRTLPPPRAAGWQRALLLLLIVIGGAAAAAPDRFVSRAPSPIGPDAPATIQGLFDLHRSAVERGDHVSYELTLDPRSKEFVACMRRLFDQGRARADALAPGRVLGLEHVAGTNLVRVRLQQRDGVGVHYVRRFLVGPVTAFPWLDIMRSVPAWYVSFPDASRSGECVEQVSLRGVVGEEDRAVAAAGARGLDLLA